MAVTEHTIKKNIFVVKFIWWENCKGITFIKSISGPFIVIIIVDNREVNGNKNKIIVIKIIILLVNLIYFSFLNFAATKQCFFLNYEKL